MDLMFGRVLLILLITGSCWKCLARTEVNRFISSHDYAGDTAKLHVLIGKGKSLIYQYPDSALNFLTEAIGLSERNGLRNESAESKNWAGVVHYVKGEYDRALQLFMDALQTYREANDHYGLSRCYNHIGLIYQTQQRYEEAIAYHRKGVSHGRAIRDLGRQAPNHFNIGLAYDETGRYDSAFHYLQLCLDQSRNIGEHRLIIMTLNRMAKVNFHLGDHSVSESLYDSALRYPIDQNNWETCFSLAGLAEVYNAVGRHDEAISTGLKSLSLAKQINARWDIVHAAEILSRAYANTGHFQQAYETAIMMHAYKDSMFNEEKENKLNYIHLKENELLKANLEKENALQSVKLKQKNFQITTAVVISASLLVIVSVLYSRHRQKSELNKQLTIRNQQIEQQNKDLSELNEAKNQLLSIISHDLRSPFASLQGLLSLVRSGGLEEAERMKLFSNLEQSFLSVSGMLDGLLQWAHTQMKDLRTVPERLSVDELIEKTRSFWEPTMRQKQIKYNFAKGGYEVYADRYQLKTAIRNVLGNAIKFTQPSGSVSIETILKNDKVGIIICDTGVGMPAAIRDTLFKFQKGNQRPGTLMEKGSGLGLLISHQLLEKNGGSIDVESTEGEGTTFTLWVPSA